jgi:SAM-dependent methyltransferase
VHALQNLQRLHPNGGECVMEARLFPEGTVPEYTTALWYEGRDSAPHVEEAAHRGRLDIAAKFINELAREHVAAGGPLLQVVDLGCGDGGLLSLLDSNLVRGWGYDLQMSNVEASRKRGVDVRYGDVVEHFDLIDWGDLVVCTEFLEHLVAPEAFLQKVAGHARYVVASSPFTETLEDHYEFHCYAWDIDGYTDLLKRSGFISRRIETWSMFQVHLAEVTRSRD